MVNNLGSRLTSRAVFFVSLNAAFEIRFLVCPSVQQRPSPLSRVEAKCFVQDMPRDQSDPTCTRLIPACSREQEHLLVPGVWSQCCCVLGVTTLLNNEVQRTLLLEQPSSPRTCVQSVEKLTLGVTQVCNPLDGVCVS